MSGVRHDRSLTIDEDLVRAYSRRGNYHSEATDAAALGLPGLVVQGVQVAGPAYGILLDAWGEEFLSHGEIDLKFVGMVTAGQTVDAVVLFDDRDPTGDDDATLEVVNRDAGTTAVVGSARRRTG